MATVAGSVRSSSLSARCRSAGHGGQRALGVVQTVFDGVQVAGDHEHPAAEDAQHGAAPDHVVGERLSQPRQHRVLPVAA